MRRLSRAVLAAATVLLPVLSVVGHADGDLGSSARRQNQEVAVTGHEEPDPALHIEPLSGTLELYCLGCLLEKRQPAQAARPGSVSRPQTKGAPGRAEVIARRSLELPSYRAPRAPPIA